MFNRRTAFFVFLLLISVINGCVSIPAQVQLLGMDIDTGLMQVQASCIKGHRPGPIKVRAQPDSVLDADHISLLNWNVYKGQRDNWASDFSQLIQRQDILILQEALLEK